MPKNAKREQQAAAAAEREQREFEELKRRLRAETDADMAVLRALMDAERQARGIEQAAEDYSVGADWRLTETERGIDADVRAHVREETEHDAAEETRKADARIAAVRAEAAKKSESLRERFEARRAEYADKVFNIVVGAADE